LIVDSLKISLNVQGNHTALGGKHIYEMGGMKGPMILLPAFLLPGNKNKNKLRARQEG